MPITLSRTGAANQGADPQALFLKQATGEILTAFDRTTQFKERHRMRTIDSGKSAQFLATGRMPDAIYHTPGTELEGQEFAQNERVVNILGFLVSHVTLADIDDAMAHYDVRAEITNKMGEELGQKFDTAIARVTANAARAAGTVTGMPGGTKLVDANLRTDANALANAFFDAATALDEKNVPASERYGYLAAAQYYLLSRTTDIINKDWDGSGSYSEGSVRKIADIEIVKTNNLPSTNVTTGPDAMQGDFTNVAGLISNRMAVGTVKLRDLTFERERLARFIADFMSARYSMGHGILQPECAVELSLI